jgi:hypothetical protein
MVASMDLEGLGFSVICPTNLRRHSEVERSGELAASTVSCHWFDTQTFEDCRLNARMPTTR